MLLPGGASGSAGEEETVDARGDFIEGEAEDDQAGDHDKRDRKEQGQRHKRFQRDQGIAELFQDRQEVFVQDIDEERKRRKFQQVLFYVFREGIEITRQGKEENDAGIKVRGIGHVQIVFRAHGAQDPGYEKDRSGDRANRCFICQFPINGNQIPHAEKGNSVHETGQQKHVEHAEILADQIERHDK